MAWTLAVACLGIAFSGAAAGSSSGAAKDRNSLALLTELDSKGLYPPPKVYSPAGFRPPPLPTKSAGYKALPGEGGGMDVLYANKDRQTSVYRPWDTRFDLHPYNVKSPDFLKAENRLGYRKFYVANPHTPLVPNTRDREAQSSVEMMFGLAALGSVASFVFIVYNMTQALNVDEQKLGEYQLGMLRVIVYASAPWLLLGLWLLSISISFIFDPMREANCPHCPYRWQCTAMVWYVFAAPIVNALYFVVNGLWLSQLFYCIEKQADRGAAFKLINEIDQEDGPCKTLRILTSAVSRYIVFVLQLFSVVFGYMFITFRYRRNSQLCQPEVYWSATALFYTSIIVMVFTALAAICSVLLRICTTSPWLQDCVDSFYEGSLAAKAEALEKREAEEEAEAKAKAKNKTYEDEFDDWYEREQKALEEEEEEWEEVRKRHEDHLDDHAKWQDIANEKKPMRQLKAPEAEFEPITWNGNVMDSIRTLAPSPRKEEEDDDKLEIWPEDKKEEKATESRPIGSYSSVISGGNPWASGGFASPFAQAPMSAGFGMPPPAPVGSQQFLPGTLPTATLPPPGSNPFEATLPPPASNPFVTAAGPSIPASGPVMVSAGIGPQSMLVSREPFTLPPGMMPGSGINPVSSGAFPRT